MEPQEVGSGTDFATDGGKIGKDALRPPKEGSLSMLKRILPLAVAKSRMTAFSPEEHISGQGQTIEKVGFTSNLLSFSNGCQARCTNFATGGGKIEKNALKPLANVTKKSSRFYYQLFRVDWLVIKLVIMSNCHRDKRPCAPISLALCHAIILAYSSTC